jgi:hypothetical protein
MDLSEAFRNHGGKRNLDDIGILTLCTPPIVFLHAYSFQGLLDVAFLAGIIVLAVTGGTIQLMIGRGIYEGRRWRWMAAFAISLISLAADATLPAILASIPGTQGLIFLGLTAGTIISLVLSLLVASLLLSLDSRIYCRMVNPRKAEGENATLTRCRIRTTNHSLARDSLHEFSPTWINRKWTTTFM